MRVSKKAIKRVITEVAGDEGMKTTDLLLSKDEIAEEDLAKKMKHELKHTRNILYKLQKHNLVKFKRKRNDANGWYTYFWSFNKKRVVHLFDSIQAAKIERLNYRLNVEQNTQFFTCKSKCMRMDFEKVMEMDYSCPECGCLLERENNKKKMKEIKDEIKDIKETITDQNLLK